MIRIADVVPRTALGARILFREAAPPHARRNAAAGRSANGCRRSRRQAVLRTASREALPEECRIDPALFFAAVFFETVFSVREVDFVERQCPGIVVDPPDGRLGREAVGFLAVDEIAPYHKPGPVGLTVVGVRIRQLPDFAQRKQLIARQGLQIVMMRLFVIAVIDIGGQHIDILRTGIEVGIGPGFVPFLVARGVGVPNP